VLDCTPFNERATSVYAGLLVYSRVLPLAWQVMPAQEKWPPSQWVVVRRLLDQVKPHLAQSDCTLLAERGLVGWPLVQLCRERQSTSPTALWDRAAGARGLGHPRPDQAEHRGHPAGAALPRPSPRAGRLLWLPSLPGTKSNPGLLVRNLGSRFIAWVVWLLVHINYPIGFRNRLLVMI